MSSTLKVTNIGALTGNLAAVTNLLGISEEGIAKGWLHYDQRFGPTIRDSINISSVSDVSGGVYSPTMTNAMTDEHYVLAHSACYDENITDSNQADLGFGFPSSTTLYKCGTNSVHGDLA
jgi:hypothetical protein